MKGKIDKNGGLFINRNGKSYAKTATCILAILRMRGVADMEKLKQQIKHDDSVSTIFFCNECKGPAPCILSFATMNGVLKPGKCVVDVFECNWRVLE